MYSDTVYPCPMYILPSFDWQSPLHSNSCSLTYTPKTGVFSTSIVKMLVLGADTPMMFKVLKANLPSNIKNHPAGF